MGAPRARIASGRLSGSRRRNHRAQARRRPLHAEPKVRIAGTGSYLPETVLDNHDLFARPSIRENFELERARGSLRGVEDPERLAPEEVFDLWARQVTGIRERRVLDPEGRVTTEEMCAEAGRRALSMAGLEPGDLDLILVGSVSASDTVPNAACTVADRLGVPGLGGFTLNAACAAYVYALAVAHAFILAGLSRHVLAISGDALSHITDYSDPKTAVLFGDGAGAAVLAPADGEHGILGRPVLVGDYQRDPLYMIGQGWETPEEPEPKLRMGGGPRVLKQAITSMAEVAERALETAGRAWEEVDFVVPHQANLRITKGLEKQLELPNGRVVHAIEEYGNMSASTVGLTLDEVVRGRRGEVPDPALLVLTAVGGGYTTGALVTSWPGGARS